MSKHIISLLTMINIDVTQVVLLNIKLKEPMRHCE